MRASILIFCALPAAAAVCGLNDIEGAYGFQLSGSSTISGRPSPVGGVGRLVFEGNRRTVSGYSSVNFNGFFLGNPVTGSYQFDSDCTLTWSMQDDSGAFQHFKGTADPGGARVDYVQTDKGSGSKGTLRKVAAACTAEALQGQYRFTMSGSSTPFAGGPPVTDSVGTTAVADGAGHLTITRGDGKETAGYTVDGDCFVQIEFGATKLRGILVDGGRTVLAMQTDPQHVASATLSK
jgi:hypothetical protein